MSKTEKNVCPECGMQGVTDPSSCPNCTGKVPRIRKGDLSPGGWILLVLAFIVIGVIAGAAGVGDFIYIVFAALILFTVVAGIVSALRKKG